MGLALFSLAWPEKSSLRANFWEPLGPKSTKRRPETNSIPNKHPIFQVRNHVSFREGTPWRIKILKSWRFCPGFKRWIFPDFVVLGSWFFTFRRSFSGEYYRIWIVGWFWQIKKHIYIYLSDIFAKDREIVIDSHDIQHVPWQFFVTCDNFSVTSNEGERVFVSLGHQWSPMIGNCWTYTVWTMNFHLRWQGAFHRSENGTANKETMGIERMFDGSKVQGSRKIRLAGWWTREFPPNKWLDISGRTSF